jgi:hypothetical protein
MKCCMKLIAAISHNNYYSYVGPLLHSMGILRLQMESSGEYFE